MRHILLWETWQGVHVCLMSALSRPMQQRQGVLVEADERCRGRMALAWRFSMGWVGAPRAKRCRFLLVSASINHDQPYAAACHFHVCCIVLHPEAHNKDGLSLAQTAAQPARR